MIDLYGGEAVRVSEEKKRELHEQFIQSAEMQYKTMLSSIEAMYGKLPDTLTQEQCDQIVDQALSTLMSLLIKQAEKSGEDFKAAAEKFDMSEILGGKEWQKTSTAT